MVLARGAGSGWCNLDLRCSWRWHCCRPHRRRRRHRHRHLRRLPRAPPKRRHRLWRWPNGYFILRQAMLPQTRKWMLRARARARARSWGAHRLRSPTSIPRRRRWRRGSPVSTCLRCRSCGGTRPTRPTRPRRHGTAPLTVRALVPAPAPALARDRARARALAWAWRRLRPTAPAPHAHAAPVGGCCRGLICQ